MRAFLSTLTVALVLTADATAQRESLITLKSTTTTPITGAQVELVNPNGRSISLGVTDANGQLRFDASVAQGQDELPFGYVRCKGPSDEEVRKVLYGDAGLTLKLNNSFRVRATYRQNAVTTGCEPERELQPLRRSDNYTREYVEKYLEEVTDKVSLDRNLALGLAGGGALTYFLARSRFGRDEDGKLPDNPQQPVLASLLGRWAFRGIVTQRGNCNFFDFNSIVTFGGTEDAFTAFMLEAGGERPYRGTARRFQDGFRFDAFATGTIPSLGNYSGTFSGLFLPNNTATGTEVIRLACGTVELAQTGTKQ